MLLPEYIRVGTEETAGIRYVGAHILAPTPGCCLSPKMGGEVRAKRASTPQVAITFVVLLGLAIVGFDLCAQETRYPFACRTQLYGYLPYATWYYGGFIRVTAFEETTRAQVVDLEAGVVIADSIIGMMAPMVVDIHPGLPFRIAADKPVCGLMGTDGTGVCPGMSFVPSQNNEGRVFILDFPQTSPGWGLQNQHFLTLFAWEEASVGVYDVMTDTTYWSGTIPDRGYQKLLLPECRCVVISSGTLTVELLSAYDSSTFILDADQDGCGTEFMFHVYSRGLDYGRHSYYEIHAFDDALVTVHDMTDTLNPAIFDSLSLLAGEHHTSSFDLYDNIFRVESTGRISVAAGSYQTDFGGPGPEAAGDYSSSVPSLDGEGMRFMLGLHCPHSGYSHGGFWVVATEDTTSVAAGSDTFHMSKDEWVWVSQSDTGVVYCEVVSDKPVCVLTGSIGGDNDFDNMMTYLPGLPGGQFGILDGDLREDRPGYGFRLLGVMPNPLRGLATVRYSVPERSRVRLAVYDTAGRLVDVLVDRVQVAGVHETSFDARAHPCGVYLCHMRAGDWTDTERLVLIS